VGADVPGQHLQLLLDHQGALDHLPDGGCVINTASINGLRGNKSLIDYAASKGAVLALTYSLAQSFQDRGIRVNSVAPGPVWTPLIPSTFPAEKVEKFGQQVPMGRAAQPDEIAPSYVFFAAPQLSSYYSGEVLAPTGGETLPADPPEAKPVLTRWRTVTTPRTQATCGRPRSARTPRPAPESVAARHGWGWPGQPG